MESSAAGPGFSVQGCEVCAVGMLARRLPGEKMPDFLRPDGVVRTLLGVVEKAHAVPTPFTSVPSLTDSVALGLVRQELRLCSRRHNLRTGSSGAGGLASEEAAFRSVFCEGERSCRHGRLPLRPDDTHGSRRLDSQSHAAALAFKYLNHEVQLGDDNLLRGLAGEDQHRELPFSGLIFRAELNSFRQTSTHSAV